MLDDYARVEKEIEYHFDPFQTFGQIGRILLNKVEEDSNEIGDLTCV